jgi:putative DNA primase/helicase
MTEAEVTQAVADAEPYSCPLTPVDFGDFLTRPLKPRELLLAPVIPAAGLAMLYAPRGIGKTYLALSMAYAVACGSECLGFKASKPRRVLYLDGEMPAVSLQERLKCISAGVGRLPEPGYFQLIAGDMLSEAIPDLSDTDSWDRLMPHFAAFDLIVMDNLSTLCRSGRENEADSWAMMQEGLLSLRRAGKSVLMVHHAGKGGGQRGTSKREDVLDTVLCLKRPPDYRPSEGARFELHIEKARGFYGEGAEPLGVQMTLQAGQLSWSYEPLVDELFQQACNLFKRGLSVRDTAQQLEISPAKAGRYRKRWQEAGAE